MALVRTADSPRDVTYAIIIAVNGDKENGRTAVHLGLYYDRGDRLRDDPSLATPVQTRRELVDGFGLPLTKIYEALAETAQWVGWEGDD